MNPPYEITNVVLNLLTSISEKIGEVNAIHLNRPSPELRKRNRIKTIKASLEIEGNTLTEEQITAILEKKRVIGPKKDILEVVNAINVYDKLPTFNPNSLKSFLSAHKMLMNGLVKEAGKLRTTGVGIFKGDKVSHIASPEDKVHFLISDLFKYLKTSKDPVLIKSCVVHYELEFIHPFVDGNGRMGRLWQTLILMKNYPVFEFLPFETIIKNRQKKYYRVLEISDKSGSSTKFIEFILQSIDESLSELLNTQNRTFTVAERIEYFKSIFQGKEFRRKDYLNTFKEISTATASRDLKYAIENGMFEKEGERRNTVYRIK